MGGLTRERLSKTFAVIDDTRVSRSVDIFDSLSGTWKTAQLSVMVENLAATSLPNLGVAIFAGGYGAYFTAKNIFRYRGCLHDSVWFVDRGNIFQRVAGLGLLSWIFTTPIPKLGALHNLMKLDLYSRLHRYRISELRYSLAAGVRLCVFSSCCKLR
jgi:hypothetical protein